MSKVNRVYGITLPRTSLGKIDKQKLREPYWKGLGQTLIARRREGRPKPEQSIEMRRDGFDSEIGAAIADWDKEKLVFLVNEGLASGITSFDITNRILLARPPEGLP